MVGLNLDAKLPKCPKYFPAIRSINLYGYLGDGTSCLVDSKQVPQTTHVSLDTPRDDGHSFPTYQVSSRLVCTTRRAVFVITRALPWQARQLVLQNEAMSNTTGASFQPEPIKPAKKKIDAGPPRRCHRGLWHAGRRRGEEPFRRHCRLQFNSKSIANKSAPPQQARRIEELFGIMPRTRTAPTALPHP